MFGLNSKNKVKKEPKVKWDEWNERFESENGTTYSSQAIGNIRFFSEDFDNEVSVIQFLRTLLSTYWDEEETFNARRPFGTSDWKQDMMKAFIALGIIDGTSDTNGEILDVDAVTFNYIVSTFIKKAL